MDALLHQFEDLKIKLEDITSATQNFNEEKCIGVGGFGKVYKGEVSHSKGRSMVAIKRLDPKYGQGIPEFLKEITTLSHYRHENLISLLGFCYQGDEMILIYEHASRGSLDRYLNSPHLTWSQRLKICLDAAEGLSYLHDPRGTHQRLIHCDVKSANILLDDQWNGKVSDFGLSIMGPANEWRSLIVTGAAGTPGYIDPQYWMTHTLTKESDVYSFGVVLFEVLCGKLCCTYSDDYVQKILVPSWIESYKQRKLNDIMFKSPTVKPLDQTSLEIFSDISYRCLKESCEDRPKMVEVVVELIRALRCQEGSEAKPYLNNREIAYAAEPPLLSRSNNELLQLLSKGVLHNGGKTWFTINKRGERCVMVSFLECVDSAPSEFNSKPDECKSRFALGAYCSKSGMFKTHVRTQFLLPGITYMVNLVFKMEHTKDEINFRHISIRYKLQGETKTSISYLVDKREDKWWMCELYQFTSDYRIADFQIIFEGFTGYSDFLLWVEGIEFQPLKKVEHKEEKQPVLDLDSDANWENNLPTDYVDIMKYSINSGLWTTKKEAYSLMCQGFLFDDGKKWFSLDNNGNKCYMISARAACNNSLLKKEIISLPESRFGEAFKFTRYFDIDIDIKLKLSSGAGCACYLVYKLPKDQSRFTAPFKVYQEEDGDIKHKDLMLYGIVYKCPVWHIYLVSPQTPVIQPKADEKPHNPVNRKKLDGIPQQREDGWREVQIWKHKYSNSKLTGHDLPVRLLLDIYGVEGPIIEGIEFRTI